MLVNELPEDYQEQSDYKDDKRYLWMIVRTIPGGEKKFQSLLLKHIQKFKKWRNELDKLEKKLQSHRLSDEEMLAYDTLKNQIEAEGNILECYNPIRTTVKESEASKSLIVPLFAGHVFVLATQRSLSSFLDREYPNGRILYDRRASNEEKSKVWVIPEAQMKFFRDFNENYADKVIVLERPYTDYAFNPKTNQPNALIKVLDGPLAGKIGYLARFKGNRRLVFKMETPNGDLAVAIPDIWNFHCVLLSDAECDPRSLVTKKERAADLLLAMILRCGYVDDACRVFHEVMEILVKKPSLVHLCQELFRTYKPLSQALPQLTAEQAELLLYLVRYEQDNPGYLRHTYRKFVIRPFLTPVTSNCGGGKNGILKHQNFTEYVLLRNIPETCFNSKEGKEVHKETPYEVHVGIIPRKHGIYDIFCNWDSFLSPYYLTSDNAHKVLVRGSKEPLQDEEKLRESFRNFAPTLYKVLTGLSFPVKPRRQMRIGNSTLDVMAITVRADSEEAVMQSPELTTLVDTCLQICREVSTTTHLAIWRRYLLGVWLHE